MVALGSAKDGDVYIFYTLYSVSRPRNETVKQADRTPSAEMISTLQAAYEEDTIFPFLDRRGELSTEIPSVERLSQEFSTKGCKG